MTPVNSQSTVWQTLATDDEGDYFEDVIEVFRMDAPAKASRAPAASRVPTVFSVLDISKLLPDPHAG